jgi:hypothetical protein
MYGFGLLAVIAEGGSGPAIELVLVRTTLSNGVRFELLAAVFVANPLF